MDSKIPEGYLFTKQHEWAKEEGGFLTVGISDYAQNALGDIVYVDLKAPGTKVEAGKTFGTIESVKAAEDLYTPVSGVVDSLNPAVKDKPEAVNKDAYGTWLIKLKDFDKGGLSGLMNSADYAKYLASLDGH